MQHVMSIREKMFFVFILLIVVFIANGVYSTMALSSINEGALRIATEHLQGVISTSESSRSMSDYRQGEYAVIDATTLPARIYAAQSTQNLADQIDITFDYIQGNRADYIRTVMFSTYVVSILNIHCTLLKWNCFVSI